MKYGRSRLFHIWPGIPLAGSSLVALLLNPRSWKRRSHSRGTEINQVQQDRVPRWTSPYRMSRAYSQMFRFAGLGLAIHANLALMAAIVIAVGRSDREQGHLHRWSATIFSPLILRLEESCTSEFPQCSIRRRCWTDVEKLKNR
ncbi:hypothetical protein K474DRAFT_108579 [Panus rudis PR-1116 ss-1]|nr:hypothetical protein K474DRAFT_108579 [Panus rudis PR-1116 ss-1]